jgi:hypothetical protein
LPFPLEDCSVFGNFVITLIYYAPKDKIRQQPENRENRNGPNLVQAFPKKWWIESDFTAPNLPLPLV